MRLTLFALAIALLVCGCAPPSDQGFARLKFQEDARKNASVRLSDYTHFSWDRLHVFHPYTSPDAIRSEVGHSVPFPHANNESHCLLVFLADEEIVSAFELPRRPVDFAELSLETGYSASESTFEVDDHGPDGALYLKRPDKHHTPG